MKWTVCDDDICELSNSNVCLVRANESNERVETREERRASRRRRRSFNANRSLMVGLLPGDNYK